MRTILLASLALLPVQTMAADDSSSTSVLAAAVDTREHGAPLQPDAILRTPIVLNGGVRVRSGLIYAAPIGYRPLTLDLYTPSQKAGVGPRPLLVYVHGGAWIMGNPREAALYADWPATLSQMAGHGYAVASISYRLAREAPFPVALQDVKSAIRYLRAHASDYGIDPAKVGIWGDSAGGHLAAMAGLTCGVAAFEPVVEAPRKPQTATVSPPPPLPSDCAQATVGWYGIYDFLDEGPVKRPPPPADDPTRLFLGCRDAPCTEGVKRVVSPITYVDGRDPPMLLIHGDKDMAVPAKQSEILYARLRSSGVPADIAVIPGVGHGWYGATSADSRAASRTAIRLTLDFFDRHLATRP
jgi:acetyl esterase/lipase